MTTTAEHIDRLVDALNRRRMGSEYEPDSSPPWERVVSDWLVYKLLVDTLDHAVRHPFDKGSAIVLASAATVLHGLDAVELFSALTDVGEATGFAAAFGQLPATGRRP